MKRAGGRAVAYGAAEVLAIANALPVDYAGTFAAALRRWKRQQSPESRDYWKRCALLQLAMLSEMGFDVVKRPLPRGRKAKP